MPFDIHEFRASRQLRSAMALLRQTLYALTRQHQYTAIRLKFIIPEGLREDEKFKAQLAQLIKKLPSNESKTKQWLFTEQAQHDNKIIFQFNYGSETATLEVQYHLTAAHEDLIVMANQEDVMPFIVRCWQPTLTKRHGLTSAPKAIFQPVQPADESTWFGVKVLLQELAMQLPQLRRVNGADGLPLAPISGVEGAVFCTVIPEEADTFLAFKKAKPAHQVAIAKEAALLKTLKHPNIVPFIGTCPQVTAKQIAHFVMPYLPTDLFTKLEFLETNKQAVDLKTQLAPWVSQMVSGITYLHDKQRILYVDIKPDNMLLTKDDTIMLADINHNKLKGSPPLYCLNDNVSYTPEYAAPELIKAGSKLTIATVTYNLSTLVVSMLALSEPLYALYNQLGIEPDPAKNPGGRYKKVDEVRKRLKKPKTAADWRLTIENKSLSLIGPTYNSECERLTRVYAAKSWQHDPKKRGDLNEAVTLAKSLVKAIAPAESAQGATAVAAPAAAAAAQPLLPETARPKRRKSIAAC